MNQHTDISNQRQFTGKHMFLVVFTFFAVIIGVNIVMAVFASKSWTGLVVKNSYVASQHFNEGLAKAELQKERGWSGELIQDKDQLVFVLHNARGEKLDDIKIMAHIGRPAHGNEDRTVTLTRANLSPDKGHYVLQNDLGPGAWIVDISAQDVSDEIYRHDFRLTVK